MNRPTNSIFTIRPYRRGGIWAFDEPALGLLAEPFVGEINQMIDAMLLQSGLIPGEQFTGMFSANRFPGIHMHLKWVRSEGGGNWYSDFGHYSYNDFNEIKEAKPRELIEGWLCPALFRFFCDAPKSIFVRAEK